MKTFFKYDYYLQITFLIAYSIGFLINWLFNLVTIYLLYFYFIVGGIQLISYLLRALMDYPKDWFYKVYGISILSVWTILLLICIGSMKDMEIITEFCLMILVAALYYSPILALGYIFYLYQTNSKYNQKQKIADQNA
jgi:hypothetical protein